MFKSLAYESIDREPRLKIFTLLKVSCVMFCLVIIDKKLLYLTTENNLSEDKINFSVPNSQ